MTTRLTLIHFLSPVHAGPGRAQDTTDFRLARDKATDIPYLPGRALREALRSGCGHPDACAAILGPEDGTAEQRRGALQFSDHPLLLLPVRSYRGTFAWITCPLVLHRFLRDAQQAGVAPPEHVPGPGVEETSLVPQEALRVLAQNGKVVLEELDLDARGDPGVTGWARWLSGGLFPEGEPDSEFWRQTLVEHFCVVHDDVFSFLVETATETVSRAVAKVGSDEAACVESWLEEVLPAETVLWGTVAGGLDGRTGEVGSAREAFGVLQDIVVQPVQAGRGTTIGRGLCKVRLLGSVS